MDGSVKLLRSDQLSRLELETAVVFGGKIFEGLLDHLTMALLVELPVHFTAEYLAPLVAFRRLAVASPIPTAPALLLPPTVLVSVMVLLNLFVRHPESPGFQAYTTTAFVIPYTP